MYTRRPTYTYSCVLVYTVTDIYTETCTYKDPITHKHVQTCIHTDLLETHRSGYTQRCVHTMTCVEICAQRHVCMQTCQQTQQHRSVPEGEFSAGDTPEVGSPEQKHWMVCCLGDGGVNERSESPSQNTPQSTSSCSYFRATALTQQPH